MCPLGIFGQEFSSQEFPRGEATPTPLPTPDSAPWLQTAKKSFLSQQHDAGKTIKQGCLG